MNDVAAQPCRLAAVQAASAFFDKAAGLEKALRLIAEAKAGGATVVAFGESWLPGYPFFVDSRPDDAWWRAAAEYAQNAIVIPGPETDALCAAAREHEVDVVIGVAERAERQPGTTWCTLLFIGREGQILGRHRKIKPTHHERSVWADGDAEGLVTHVRDYGRLGGLNCWEHNVLLPGFTLIAQGLDVHVAAWPGREPDGAPGDPVWSRQTMLSRAFASQAGAYVISVAGLRLTEHVPKRHRGLASFEHNGMSVVIDPWGEVVAGPLEGEGILYADVDRARLLAAKVACDPAGHYARPDLFRVEVDGRRGFGR
jgi:nitrilase